MNHAQRRAVDRWGAAYGWAKRCSDAAWEWWHVKHNPRCTGATFKPRPRFRVLRRGSSGLRVKRVQKRLRQLGFKSVPFGGGRGWGYYGRTTASAVKRVQKSNGLKADGVVGPATWRILFP